MSLAILYSRAQVGMDAPLVTVEVHLSNGLPSLSIVGLPETAVKESKDRVRGAILNSHFDFPARRITINLAPADLPKEGGRYDLPIALGILAASGQIPDNDCSNMNLPGSLPCPVTCAQCRGYCRWHCTRKRCNACLPFHWKTQPRQTLLKTPGWSPPGTCSISPGT